MDRQGVVDELRRYFAGKAGIVAAYLFGSTARDTAGATSDVDVGVVLGRRAPLTLAHYDEILTIQGDLEGRLQLPVDVVAMDGAPTDLIHRILRDGIIVHEGDHRRRVAFELKARNEFFDLQPILEYYRRTVLGSA